MQLVPIKIIKRGFERTHAKGYYFLLEPLQIRKKYFIYMYSELKHFYVEVKAIQAKKCRCREICIIFPNLLYLHYYRTKVIILI